MAQEPPLDRVLLFVEASRSHSRRTTLGRTPLDVWSVRRRETCQHTPHTTEIHSCPRRVSNPHHKKRAATDPRPRPRGHWDRRRRTVTTAVFKICIDLGGKINNTNALPDKILLLWNKVNANLMQQGNFIDILSSTCFRYIRPSSGTLDVELQHMIFCTEFLDGWWSWAAA